MHWVLVKCIQIPVMRASLQLRHLAGHGLGSAWTFGGLLARGVGVIGWHSSNGLLVLGTIRDRHEVGNEHHAFFRPRGERGLDTPGERSLPWDTRCSCAQLLFTENWTAWVCGALGHVRAITGRNNVRATVLVLDCSDILWGFSTSIGYSQGEEWLCSFIHRSSSPAYLPVDAGRKHQGAHLGRNTATAKHTHAWTHGSSQVHLRGGVPDSRPAARYTKCDLWAVAPVGFLAWSERVCHSTKQQPRRPITVTLRRSSPDHCRAAEQVTDDYQYSPAAVLVSEPLARWQAGNAKCTHRWQHKWTCRTP